jgi:hypothetical protein
MRFSAEFFRGDVSRGFAGPLSVGQVMSIAIFAASVLTLRFLVRRKGAPLLVRNEN